MKQCSARVFTNSYINPTKQCSEEAVIIRDGSPYCKAHDPKYIKAKAEAWSREFRIRVAGSIASKICAEINPDNPLAVAESIRDMYEALEAFDEYISTNFPANIRLKQIAVDRMERTLAKAKSKQGDGNASN